MPKVTGPLFSVAASGTLSKTLTYRNTRRGAVVSRHAVPSGLPSAAQIAHRNQFALIAADWVAASPEDKATWDALAESLGISAYDAYTKHNWQRVIDNQPTTTAYPGPAYVVAVRRVGHSTTPLSPDVEGDYYQIANLFGSPAFRRIRKPYAYLFHANTPLCYVITRATPIATPNPLYMNNSHTTTGSWIPVVGYGMPTVIII